MQERYRFEFEDTEIKFAFESLSAALKTDYAMGLGGNALASEYMLMHFDTETSRYGFKHHATRDYYHLPMEPRVVSDLI